MALISSKLRSVESGRLMFWCPGCDGAHIVGVGDGDGPRWQWNGDPERPTFTPSIHVLDPLKKQGVMINDATGRTLCHSFVVDGQIQFLSDCAHELAGKTVDIPDWETA